MSDLPESVQTLLRVGLIAVAAIAAFLVLRKGVELGVRGVMDRRTTESDGVVPPAELERRVRTIARLIVRIGGAILLTIAILMALTEFGVEIGPAVAGLGVVGIAVGFGAQTLIRDWLAGIFIVLENQYNEGDVVRLAGVEGVVNAFSLRRTTLRDLDGTVHSVPNGQITVASNLSRLWAHDELDIHLPAATDVERARDVIDHVGAELHADPDWAPRLLEAPYVAHVRPLPDGGVALKVLDQVRAAERRAVATELRQRILAALAAEGITVAEDGTDATSAESGPTTADADEDPTAPAGPKP
jgi:small conductance mechanosensitive channel